MKQFLLLSALAALTLGACRSLKVNDFHTNQAIPVRLPKLGLLVHERSFIEAFSKEYYREFVGDYDPWEAYSKTDGALSDLFQALDNELLDNINESQGDRYGHARFKLVSYQRRNSGWGWTIPSFATMFTANLAGMPCGVYRIDLELQMEITDANGKILGQYKAPGTGKAKIAFYHGYDNLSALRKGNLVAMQDAFAKIKTTMAADLPAIAEQLKAAGTIHPLDRK